MTNVLLEKKGNIAVATINRPKALNALNSEVLEDLNKLVELVNADEEIRALVLTGSGEKAFVAGKGETIPIRAERGWSQYGLERSGGGVQNGNCVSNLDAIFAEKVFFFDFLT